MSELSESDVPPPPPPLPVATEEKKTVASELTPSADPAKESALGPLATPQVKDLDTPGSSDTAVEEEVEGMATRNEDEVAPAKEIPVSTPAAAPKSEATPAAAPESEATTAAAPEPKATSAAIVESESKAPPSTANQFETPVVEAEPKAAPASVAVVESETKAPPPSTLVESEPKAAPAPAGVVQSEPPVDPKAEAAPSQAPPTTVPPPTITAPRAATVPPAKPAELDAFGRVKRKQDETVEASPARQHEREPRVRARRERDLERLRKEKDRLYPRSKAPPERRRPRSRSPRGSEPRKRARVDGGRRESDRLFCPKAERIRILLLGTAHRDFADYVKGQFEQHGWKLDSRYLGGEALGTVINQAYWDGKDYVLVLGKQNEDSGTCSIRIFQGLDRRGEPLAQSSTAKLHEAIGRIHEHSGGPPPPLYTPPPSQYRAPPTAWAPRPVPQPRPPAYDRRRYEPPPEVRYAAPRPALRERWAPPPARPVDPPYDPWRGVPPRRYDERPRYEEAPRGTFYAPPPAQSAPPPSSGYGDFNANAIGNLLSYLEQRVGPGSASQPPPQQQQQQQDHWKDQRAPHPPYDRMY